MTNRMLVRGAFASYWALSGGCLKMRSLFSSLVSCSSVWIVVFPRSVSRMSDANRISRWSTSFRCVLCCPWQLIRDLLSCIMLTRRIPTDLVVIIIWFSSGVCKLLTQRDNRFFWRDCAWVSQKGPESDNVRRGCWSYILTWKSFYWNCII